MSNIVERFGELNEEYRTWLLSSKYLRDRNDYLKSVDQEIRGLALIVFKREDYFVWWYMNTKHSELDGKTHYEYAKQNGLKEIKIMLNGLISPPAT